jgi:hypothetical protein
VSDEERLAQRIKLAEAMVGLALTLWCLWSMIPQHRRQQWRMRALLTLGRWTGSAARRTGAASMRAELATGQENYVLPYGLALAREQLTVMYDRTRGVTP